jgi:hypothetical protein
MYIYNFKRNLTACNYVLHYIIEVGRSRLTESKLTNHSSDRIATEWFTKKYSVFRSNRSLGRLTVLNETFLSDGIGSDRFEWNLFFNTLLSTLVTLTSYDIFTYNLQYNIYSNYSILYNQQCCHTDIIITYYVFTYYYLFIL